jgi:hypothetical protein
MATGRRHGQGLSCAQANSPTRARAEAFRLPLAADEASGSTELLDGKNSFDVLTSSHRSQRLFSQKVRS